jgi:hypothetical protein
VKTQIGLAIALLLLATSILGYGQEPSPNPTPPAPSDVIGSQLIVWSQMQKPEPIRQDSPQDSPHGQFDRLSNSERLDRRGADDNNNHKNRSILRPSVTNNNHNIQLGSDSKQ